MVCVRVKLSQSSESDASISKQVPTRTHTIPNASEKDVTSGNQAHALKKRTRRMSCAYSLTDGKSDAGKFKAPWQEIALNLLHNTFLVLTYIVNIRDSLRGVE